MSGAQPNPKLVLFSVIMLWLAAICLICTGLAFVTIWRNLENKSRARRFCLFVTSFILIIENHKFVKIEDANQFFLDDWKGFVVLSIDLGLS